MFSLSHESEDGEGVSLRSIRNMIEELVANEDKSNPLSDEDIRILLDKKGYKFARRTITKHRETLNIPAKRLRKKP